jgi:hypothetical protein
MSHFVAITYETHSEYLYELDTLIVVKQMQRDSIPLDPNYVFGTGSGLWLLLRTLFSGVEETGDGFLIPGPFTEDQVEKLTDFCDGLFVDDYAGCGPIIEVNEEGAHFDTVSDGTFYIHSMYDDFVSLARFLKELPITEGGDEEDGSDDEDEDYD